MGRLRGFTDERKAATVDGQTLTGPNVRRGDRQDHGPGGAGGSLADCDASGSAEDDEVEEVAPRGEGPLLVAEGLLEHAEEAQEHRVERAAPFAVPADDHPEELEGLPPGKGAIADKLGATPCTAREHHWPPRGSPDGSSTSAGKSVGPFTSIHHHTRTE